MVTLNRSALKRTSAQTQLNRVKESVQKKESSQKDARQWQPTVDDNGNGYAVIRFLPARTEEGLPYVKQYNQGFKVENRWFINLCPTTIGLPSPAVEHTSALWDSGLDSDKVIARQRKRKLRYFSNILVVKDPKNPENDGKVFIFAYGQKIFEKIQGVINPPEEFDETPRDPFSFFDGVNFKLKIRNKDGYRNFDESTFEYAGDLFNGDEDKLGDILTRLHDIDALNDPKEFKSYEELKKELDRVLGMKVASENSPVQRAAINDKLDATKSTDYVESRSRQSSETEQNDYSDDLKMFEELMKDD